MRIGLIDVDSHNFPNLALMKLSAWHKKQGDSVEKWNGLKKYDRVYMSKVFDEIYTPDMPFLIQSDEIIRGGTGYNLTTTLPHEIEHMMPDYSLYDITNTAYGFLTRGCPRACPFCLVASKEGRKSMKVANVSEWWSGQKEIILLDPNTLASKDHLNLLEQLADTKASVDFSQGIDVRLLTEENINALNKINVKMLHFAWDLMDESDRIIKELNLYKKYGKLTERQTRVYVLTNFNTTFEEDLFRVYSLREMEFDPYVMIYNKPTAPTNVKQLQRWVNNKFIWRSCSSFYDYKP